MACSKIETNKKTRESAASSMATVEPDWSQLPTDILILISERIDNEIDLIRFRSICSNWRSSSIPIHHTNILPFKFPLPKLPFAIDSINKNTSFRYLSKRSIFLIKPPPQQDQTLILRPWLIKITQNSSGKTKLSQSSLISIHKTNSLAFHFPYMLDFNKLSVLNLGCEFIVEEDSRYRADCIYPEKVIVATTFYGSKPLALSMIRSYQCLILFRCSDGHCSVFPDVSTFIADICFFKQRIYAVDRIGRTVIVGLEEEEDSSVQLVAEPLVDSGDMKYLVESEGKLLLVDIDHDNLRIDVFMLDDKGRKWVKLKNLRDRVLFLGDGCSFSASASDLCVPKGNCVIFMNNIFFFSYMKMEYGMSIFHLDQGHRQLSPLYRHPEYFKLFWPPPEWIVKSCIPS
ncbi:unnamed protein product [Trifolium pratense]|uniref:Uncharacterized protein n=1 Tax=Trifolium pratense TaxID=57577 RepID=A0ACB0J4W9_TRIPR|nr:unnamed protein product [Trifolium pratense]